MDSLGVSMRTFVLLGARPGHIYVRLEVSLTFSRLTRSATALRLYPLLLKPIAPAASGEMVSVGAVALALLCIRRPVPPLPP
jgi:hypothetical protein